MKKFNKLLSILILIAGVILYFTNKELRLITKKLEKLSIIYSKEIPQIAKTLDGIDGSYFTFLAKKKIIQKKLTFSQYLNDEKLFIEKLNLVNSQAKKLTNHHYSIAQSLAKIAKNSKFKGANKGAEAFRNAILNITTKDKNKNGYKIQLPNLENHIAKMNDTINVLINNTIKKISDSLKIEVENNLDILDDKERSFFVKSLMTRIDELQKNKKELEKITIESQISFKKNSLTSQEIPKEIKTFVKKFNDINEEYKKYELTKKNLIRHKKIAEEINLKIIKLTKINKEKNRLVNKQKQITFRLKESLKRFTGDRDLVEIVAKIFKIDKKSGFLMLDKGELDGIKKNFSMIVSRSGEFIGKIRVYKTAKNHAFAKIDLESIKNNIFPEYGDIVITEVQTIQ